MPGTARTRFQFRDKTPTIVVVTTVLLFANGVLSWGTDFWIDHFAPRYPIGSSLFRIQLRPGSAEFVPRWLGIYQSWSLWIGFAILGLLLLLWFVYWLKGHVVPL
jgi:hypothetical protein